LGGSKQWKPGSRITRSLLAPSSAGGSLTASLIRQSIASRPVVPG
jgi:hypothetical protein